MKSANLASRKHIAVFVAWSFLASQLGAQQPAQVVEKPHAPVLIRPYLPTSMPPARQINSNRLHDLIRGGKLYLTVQDAIALAIENNLDLEVDRYGPLRAEWNLKRAASRRTAARRHFGNSLANQAVSGQGVQGSEVSAGLASNGGSNVSTSAPQNVQQIGPITPNLDADFQNQSVYSHTTSPQSNVVVSQTPALVDIHHVYDSFRPARANYQAAMYRLRLTNPI